VRKRLFRSHHDTTESFSIGRAHRGGQSISVADSDGLPFSVNLDLVRRRERHEIHLQFRIVELFEGSIGDKQSVASEQRLHTAVDQRLGRFMVVISSSRLLSNTCGGGKKENGNNE